jgi:hypothetical protein
MTKVWGGIYGVGMVKIRAMSDTESKRKGIMGQVA